MIRFKTSSKYVENYTKKIENTVLHFAENTDGALTAYARYNPDFTLPTSGVFLTRNSTDDGFKSVEPTDFSTCSKSFLSYVLKSVGSTLLKPSSVEFRVRKTPDVGSVKSGLYLAYAVNAPSVFSAKCSTVFSIFFV